MVKDQNTYNFLELLNKRKINYHYEGEWLVIDGDIDNSVSLSFILKNIKLPDYIKFNNDSNVGLSNNFLTSLPDHIEFNNSGIVYLHLNLLTSLPDNIKFNCKGHIYLDSDSVNNSLESLPDNIEDFYDKLDQITKYYISKKFSDHWFFEKDRFGL